jgi:hypothetical protein
LEFNRCPNKARRRRQNLWCERHARHFRECKLLLLGAVALALRHYLLQGGSGFGAAAVGATRTVATLADCHIAARLGKRLTPSNRRRLTQHQRKQQNPLPAAHRF